ncbi:MAG TPA: ATP-binding protein [Candidatus Acidoferrales bacterium]|nr:ATP-binding protein [Candidatus Acidoferrales bacterium]
MTATDPPGAQGFALRDDSLELRRLFLHAISRFGEAGAVFLDKKRQRALAGMSPMAGKSDVVLVPLAASNRTLGVVTVAVDRRPDAAMLEGLAGFCELATELVEIDRALAAARRQSRDSRLLAMVNERLHKSLDRRDVLFGIVEGVRAAFGADRCIVYQRVPESERVSVAAVAAQGGAPLPSGTIPLDADLRKVFGGLTVRRDGIEGSEAFGTTAQCALALPFVVDGRVEDALVLSFDRPHAFEEADLAALRSLAFHVGLALSNARLYERERARRTQAESLERVVRILRDTQYVDEVMLVFVVTVSHELPVDCAIYRLEGDALVRRALRMREQRSPTFEERVDRQYLEPFLAVDEPSDAALLPRAVRGALFEGFGGIMVPLRLDGALWGMLVIRTTDTELEWSQEERATFFRTLGSHLEISLANAHAYERELRRAQERQTLAEAARTILSHRALGPLAAVMCRLASTLVHADGACVLSWNGESYAMAGSYGEFVDDLVATSGFDRAHRVERMTGLVSDERRVQRLIDGPGYVVIPLSRTAADEEGNTIDAFLLVGNRERERFGREDLRLLQELGALLALALRNIDLYEAIVHANHALQESSEFKDDLLAMLAHDFKGPLTIIHGYCELLLESETSGREQVEAVLAQTQRLVQLSDDALVLAQTQAEGFSMARTIVDLGAFVAECVEEDAGENPRVVLETPDDVVPVELDPQRFRHVIDNLVSNALKYSRGTVRIGVRVEGKRAAIDVEDHGIGIPAEELSMLFTRFGRASNARRQGIAGSGIGLYVAKKIVEVHRGTLGVRSIEREGSTFTVSLPLVAAT